MFGKSHRYRMFSNRIHRLIAEVRQVKRGNDFAKAIKFHGSGSYRAENFSISDCAATEQSHTTNPS